MMVRLIEAVAQDANELWTIEWRELERLMGEALRGLGFDVVVTRPGKDGGYDLELRAKEPPADVYLVEVKHWSGQKVGAAHLKKFIKVTASKQAAGALFLSTSGFASTVYSGLIELGAPVRLAESDKVVSLCRAYYRLKSGLWLDASDAKAHLFSGTVWLGGTDGGAAT